MRNTYKKTVEIVCMRAKDGSFTFGEKRRDGTYEITAKAKDETEFFKVGLSFFDEKYLQKLLNSFNAKKLTDKTKNED